MKDIGREWVDWQLAALEQSLRKSRRSPWELFVPSDSFYGLLESGESDDLQRATDALGTHVGLDGIPEAVYELGLRMRTDVAGQISRTPDRRSRIRIPLFYVGKPVQLGAILAHELTHEVFSTEGSFFSDLDETERLTDLGSIVLGLGCVVLNGMVSESEAGMSQTQVLGYLSPELKAYAFLKTIQVHGVPAAEAMEHLTPVALQVFLSVSS